MEIITKEHLLEPALKEIITPFFQEYWRYYIDNEETAVSFDFWMYDRTGELGQALYDFIGNQYDSFDDAVEVLKIG